MKKLSWSFLFFLCLAVIFSPIAGSHKACAATASFAQKYTGVAVGDSVTYKVKHLKKHQTVKYSVSNKSRASIKKNTGKLTAKKPGRVIVKAKIYNKNGEKVCTLKDTVTVKKNGTYLTGAVFTADEDINPFDFTLSLNCDRILLEKEVKKTELTLSLKGSNAEALTADFTDLSADGKTVTYTLSKPSQSALCPGDSSMDGTYKVTSKNFDGSLCVGYAERVTANTLIGFTLNPEGVPVPKVTVTLETESGTKSTTSDENGYYRIKTSDTPVKLTAKKSGWQNASVTDVEISATGPMCENIVLKESDDTAAAVEVVVTDENDCPINDALVKLYAAGKQIGSAQTDKNGAVLFSNSAFSAATACPCSQFFLRAGQEETLTYSASQRPTASSAVHSQDKSFVNTADLTVCVCADETSDNCDAVFSFCFADIFTDFAQVYVQLGAENVKISQSFVRNSLTYPNCVIAFYQSDGTIIATNFTTPPLLADGGLNTGKDSVTITEVFTNSSQLQVLKS